MAQGQALSNGWFLLVGQDTDQFTDFEDLILNVAAGSLATAFALALIGGLATSASMLRRVTAITDAGRDIMRGNLARRIALRGSSDEFDRLSANLNEMLDRIQMLMDGLRQVSNDIAHDMRTPLTRLRQRLELARTKATTVADYETAVDKAIAETDEILDTFGALLRIAQIEAGTRRAAFTDVDLSGVLQTIVETYAAVAEDHEHGLASRIADGVTVQGDRQLLTQMFANIVENGLRHTPAGTRIEIELAGASAPVCTIRDNGPGIPEPERQKVFRRFYRLDSSRATPGSGLGLSLVAAVAELHRIVVEIGDNQPGLWVTLRFPGA
jgi:signal transduction histidine kinase